MQNSGGHLMAKRVMVLVTGIAMAGTVAPVSAFARVDAWGGTAVASEDGNLGDVTIDTDPYVQLDVESRSDRTSVLPCALMLDGMVTGSAEACPSFDAVAEVSGGKVVSYEGKEAGALEAAVAEAKASLDALVGHGGYDVAVAVADLGCRVEIKDDSTFSKLLGSHGVGDTEEEALAAAKACLEDAMGDAPAVLKVDVAHEQRLLVTALE